MKMTETIKLPLLTLMLASLFAISCDGGKEPEPTFADPTISVTVPEGGLTPEVGTTVTITVDVAAEAGLSGLFLNDNSIASFAGTETTASITHDQLITNLNPITLTFTIEDAQGTRISAAVVTINPVEGIDLGYLLVDFAGGSSGNEEKSVASWDNRTKWTMTVSGEIGTSATLENVAGQGKVVQFSASNPDPNDESKVLKYSKADGETSGGNWGGWTNLLIGLSGKVPASEIEALPTYNVASSSLTHGTKVVALDVYYDATVDQDFTWEGMKGFTDIWNSDASKGLKIDLILGNYDVHAGVEVGYDNRGYHISYSGYVAEPNKWVTVYFDLLDEGRTAFFYANRDDDNSSNSVAADQVDCFNLKVSPGYDAKTGGDNIDTNPIYFKNLRIVDAE